jgi:hypothetical protein
MSTIAPHQLASLSDRPYLAHSAPSSGCMLYVCSRGGGVVKHSQLYALHWRMYHQEGWFSLKAPSTNKRLHGIRLQHIIRFKRVSVQITLALTPCSLTPWGVLHTVSLEIGFRARGIG